MKAICVLFTLFLTDVVGIGKKNGTPESGPFRSVLVNVTPCEHIPISLEKDPPIQLFVQAYPGTKTKANMLRGKLSVFRETKQVKIKLKSFLWEAGRWKLTYLMNGLSCKGVLLDLIARAVKFELYDGKKCAFLKGDFSFQDLDLNMIQHIWASEMEYGRVMWRGEIIVGTQEYSCMDYETVVERA